MALCCVALQHPDNNVRLVCIELLGSVVASIVADNKQAEQDKATIDHIMAALPLNYLEASESADSLFTGHEMAFHPPYLTTVESSYNARQRANS